MKITRIEPQKNPNRVNIYIDNEFAFGLDVEIMYKHSLKADMNIDEHFLENILKAEELNKVINQALNLLSYRQRSEKEIFNSLKKKGNEEYYIEKAIEYCRNQNYLNDKSFAESFIKDKTNINKLGSQRIRYELISKGISKEIIEDVLQINNEDEYEMAKDLALKKLKSYKGQDNNSIYRKLGGFLQRRGYTYDIVSKVLREVLRCGD